MIDRELHKGDIIIADGGGRRNYGVIVTNNSANYRSDRIGVVYISTTTEEVGPAYVNIFTNQQARVMCNMVWNIWKTDIDEFVRECTADELRDIDKALRYTFGLCEPQKNCDSTYDIGDMAKALADGSDKDMRDIIAKLKEENEHLRNEVCTSNETVVAFSEIAEEYEQTKRDVIALTTERDTYKVLYDQLLGKLLGNH